MPCILNAANEVAVDAFLREQCSFTAMSDLIGTTDAKSVFIPQPSLEDYVETDRRSRQLAQEYLKSSVFHC